MISYLLVVEQHRTQIVRSEERFSRNAETDLVCRVLLEKKEPVRPAPLALRHTILEFDLLQPGQAALNSHPLPRLSPARRRFRHDAPLRVPAPCPSHPPV